MAKFKPFIAIAFRGKYLVVCLCNACTCARHASDTPTTNITMWDQVFYQQHMRTIRKCVVAFFSAWNSLEAACGLCIDAWTDDNHIILLSMEKNSCGLVSCSCYVHNEKYKMNRKKPCWQCAYLRIARSLLFFLAIYMYYADAHSLHTKLFYCLRLA